jgi:predicted DNA-binding ribbon-helix-helix protein
MPPVKGKTALISRNVFVGGRRTSIRLEPELWEALTLISNLEQKSLHQLCDAVAALDWANEGSFTSAVRRYVIHYLCLQAKQDFHQRRQEPRPALYR